MISLTLHKSGQLKLQVSFPDTWDELTTEELLLICKTQLIPATPQKNRAAVFIELLKSRCSQHHTLPSNFLDLLNMEDVANNGYPLVEFLYSQNNRTIQPFKVLCVPGIKNPLFGPADAFNSLVCGEFEDTEIFFGRFLQSPTLESLASLAAVIFRPADDSGMKIVSYITTGRDTTERYDYKSTLPYLMKLPFDMLYTIFAWYTGCRNQLPLLFPTVHQGSPESASNEPDLTAFTKCIHAGAGPKNGTRYQVRLLPLKEFFFDMEQEAIHAKQLQEKYEQSKNVH